MTAGGSTDKIQYSIILFTSLVVKYLMAANHYSSTLHVYSTISMIKYHPSCSVLISIVFIACFSFSKFY